MLAASQSRIVISYGGGVQSTAMLVLAAEGKIQASEAVFCNVGEDSESPETLRYVRDVIRPWAAGRGIAVHEIQRTDRNGAPFKTLLQYHNENVRRTGATPLPVKMTGAGGGGIANRTCTAQWKAGPVSKWVKQHGGTPDNPVLLALGISMDEIHRMNNRNDTPFERRVFPLIDLRLTRSDCENIIARAGLPVPRKSACWFCPFHRVAAWAEIRRDNPERFEAVAALETDMNVARSKMGKVPFYWTGRGVSMRSIEPKQDTIPGLEAPDGVEDCDSGACWT